MYFDLKPSLSDCFYRSKFDIEGEVLKQLRTVNGTNFKFALIENFYKINILLGCNCLLLAWHFN